MLQGPALLAHVYGPPAALKYSVAARPGTAVDAAAQAAAVSNRFRPNRKPPILPTHFASIVSRPRDISGGVRGTRPEGLQFCRAHRYATRKGYPAGLVGSRKSVVHP